MASIVERLEGGLSRAAGRLLPSVRAQAAEAQAFRVAFRDKPWEFDAYNGLLSELDAETLAFLVDQLQYEEVLHLGGAGKPSSESDRMRQVERSRWQYRWDPLTRWVVRLWTYFGYGLNVDIVPDDEAAVPVWEEYWTAKRNRPVFGQRRLRYNSDVLLRDGELFFVNFVSEVTGEVTTRRLLTDEVTEIVRHPDDRDTVLFYKRAITNGPMAGQALYYPDWTAEPDELDAWWEKAIGTATGAIRMDVAMPETGRAYTTCNVVAVQINLGTEGRGWPQMTSGLTWSSAYGKILQDRAAVVRKRAMYDSKVKVKGGQRALAYVQGRVQSSNVTQGGMERNPPASAGSDWLENEAVDRSPINMGNSGAQEAELDSTAIFGMATLAGGLFPHYAGKGEAFRLATACYSDDTEVLTENGWKRYEDYRPGERIAAYDHEHRRIVYTVPRAMHLYEYEGPMVHLRGRTVDALVTPNHRMLVLNENNEPRWEIVEAGQLPSRFALPSKALLGNADGVSHFLLPAAGYKPARFLPMNRWLQFLGWWIAEGSAYESKTGIVQTSLVQMASNVDECQEIERVLADLPFNFCCDVNAHGMKRWRTSERALFDWLVQYCGRLQPERRIPEFVFGMDTCQSKLLVDALWQGDGFSDDREHYRGALTSTSLGLLDDVQRLLILYGEWGQITVQREAGTHPQCPNSLACYYLYRADRDKLSLARTKNVTEEQYSGMVWCFDASPYGMFITRRNGYPLIAGNSAMETPIRRGFSDYQLTWADVFRDVCQIVLEAAQKYGGASFETIACDVNQDALVNMDPLAVQQAATAIAAIATTGAVPMDEVERAGNRVLVLALQSLGVGDADDVVNPPEEEGEGLPPVVERNLIGEAADRIIAGLELEGNHAEA